MPSRGIPLLGYAPAAVSPGFLCSKWRQKKAPCPGSLCRGYGASARKECVDGTVRLCLDSGNGLFDAEGLLFAGRHVLECDDSVAHLVLSDEGDKRNLAGIGI